MRAVNLLPREATKQRTTPFGVTQQNLPVVVGGVLGVFVVGLLAVSFMHASGKVSDAKARLREVQTQLANTPEPPQPKPVPNAQLAGEKSARVTAVSIAIGARLSIDRVLRELSLVLPDDITLSNLTIGQSVSALAPTASLSLAGYTYSHDSVARLLSRLALVPDLTNVVLGGSSTAVTDSTTPSDSGVSGPVSFTISADVKLPPGAAAVAPPPAVPTPPPSTDTTTTGSSS
jgi:Tfp pilus assembly protein PilN